MGRNERLLKLRLYGQLPVKKEKLILSGDVPSPVNPPPGCVFHTRCPYAKDDCKNKVPELKPAPGTDNTDYLQACLRAGEIAFE